jgi:hypothetical protein
MLATPIHATCKTEYSDTYARNSGDEHCIHKQDKAKHKNAGDRNSAQRHNCRDNQDHASKPKHSFAYRSAADGSKYQNRPTRRKAQLSKMFAKYGSSYDIFATCGTRNGQATSTTHFKAPSLAGSYRAHLLAFWISHSPDARTNSLAVISSTGINTQRC